MQGLQGLIPMIIIFALMYFMLIRPAQKQRKNTQSALRRNLTFF